MCMRQCCIECMSMPVWDGVRGRGRGGGRKDLGHRLATQPVVVGGWVRWSGWPVCPWYGCNCVGIGQGHPRNSIFPMRQRNV